MSVEAAAADPRNIRNLRRGATPGQIVATVVMALVALRVAVWLVINPRFEWRIVADYLFAEPILWGIGMTLGLTALCMVLGTLLGILLAVMKMSGLAPLRLCASAFIWFFRAVPMLVQLIFWFNLSYLIPRIGLGIPFGPEWISWDTNDLINAFTAAVIGLTIHEAAYMAEIVRSGLLSVESGQRDAARALGYPERTVFPRFILPQAMRVIIPPTGSQVISLLKGTSLVSVIGMTDLLHAAQTIYSINFEVVPLLMVTSIWYLTLIGILSLFQARLERRLSRGFGRSGDTKVRNKPAGAARFE